MPQFTITPVSDHLDIDIRNKIDLKTKPIGALGLLEDTAFTIARIQQTLTPSLNAPTIAVFAGDHGIAKTGLVNPYPQEVTYQMVMNFVKGGAAINVLSKQNNIDIKIIDAGVNYDFGTVDKLIDAKIAYGTANYLEGPAMTQAQCEQAIAKGAEIIQSIFNKGSNVVGFGEMGIGNTSAASLLMSVICDIPIADCVGKGTGANQEQLAGKIKTLQQVLEKHQDLDKANPIAILSTFGGFEIAQICGGMLKAAELGMIILVDGFICTAALLVAQMIEKAILDYCVFTHQSEEHGHQLMLKTINAKPLLQLGMRLGEGTGCAVAYPIVQSACTFLNEMASFEGAGVSQQSAI
ncbi:nicotinate-nucleotide--dimethylbenzimidazole phosphoribosyltransferase [Fulvivirga sp. 2943]|uniref:Nicotinate-nucleotide--dimethylbenzimidazole phosphoribosyltransferase n=2 Tax=Fulvivirga sediminis TaxID=2803949 RepID=A0A937K1B0_9BACT|nr:nicotinate-nucleotide--dimethylbenzimidazole phosphoribosyltransferase [Fulvivirga sediminis]MBL3657281.1 nicotinate-nucleotide--dimethylbenzimidazole phosphoribosyltransferase [Fulvivirga sediminis]